MSIVFDINDPVEYGSRVAAASALLFSFDLFYFGIVRRLVGPSLWWYPELTGQRSGRAYILTAMLFCAFLFGIVASLFHPPTVGDAAVVGALLGILTFGVFNACALVLVDDWTPITACFDMLYGVGTYAGASAVIWHLLP